MSDISTDRIKTKIVELKLQVGLLREQERAAERSGSRRDDGAYQHFQANQKLYAIKVLNELIEETDGTG
jgi:hypothetical protein